MPFFFSLLKAYGRPTLSLEATLARGELLLVSVAIAGGALGELVASGRYQTVPKLVASGGSVIVLCCASFWFADVSAVVASSSELNASSVVRGSMVMFGLAVATGASCIALSEVEA